jgi:O-antigen/teichoic acid export membrane protein
LIWNFLGWFLLKRQISELPIFPFRWNKQVFLTIWRHGVNFQVISILLIMSEPLAKGLLSYYTNLSAVTFFEMANRLILQGRAILTSANQVITPYYAKLESEDNVKIHQTYLRNLQLITLMGSALFATMIATAPLISLLWIGYIETQFLFFIGILALGWFLNSLSIPAYFANIGIGHLGPNVKGHFAIMVGMLLLGLSLGPWFKPYGSALAWPGGLLLGAYIIDDGFLRHVRLSRQHWLRNLTIRYVLLNFSAGLIAALSSWYFLRTGDTNSIWIALACLGASLALIAMLSVRKVLALIRFNASQLS